MKYLLCLFLISCAFAPKQLTPSVVALEVASSDSGIGTAFAIQNDGDKTYFLTNRHLCSAGNAANYTIRSTKNITHPASFVAVSTTADLCLLSVNGKFPILHLARSTPEFGDHVFVFGAGDGFLNITEGYIGLGPRKTEAGKSMMLSVRIYFGNSGSPVVNASGNVVGIIYAFNPSYSQLSYMIVVSEIDRFLGEAI